MCLCDHRCVKEVAQHTHQQQLVNRVGSLMFLDLEFCGCGQLVKKLKFLPSRPVFLYRWFWQGRGRRESYTFHAGGIPPTARNKVIGFHQTHPRPEKKKNELQDTPLPPLCNVGVNGRRFAYRCRPMGGHMSTLHEGGGGMKNIHQKNRNLSFLTCGCVREEVIRKSGSLKSCSFNLDWFECPDWLK